MIDKTKTREVEAVAFGYLAFAARACQEIDWDACREGDRLNLVDDLFSFMHPKGSGLADVSAASRRIWEKDIRSVIPAIQKALKGDFEALVDKEPQDIHLESAEIDMFAFATDRFGPYRRAIMVGDDVQTARAHLQNYLVESRITPAQIRRCPTCTKIFLLRKKPQRESNTSSQELKFYYCSQSCCMKSRPKASDSNAATPRRGARKKAKPTRPHTVSR